MTTPNPLVFLLDVDNTLLDNDRIERDLKDHLEHEFGADCSRRYWEILEALRAELGYADYLGALQRYRLGRMNDPSLLLMSAFLVDYPFEQRLYRQVFDVIRYLDTFGLTVILSDGDVVFQPRKVQRSGLWSAVQGRVLIYIHKEQMLDAISERFPATHYVMVDDKLRILQAMKRILGPRLTTIFPRQGKYALDPQNNRDYAAADITVETIGDLLAQDFSALIDIQRIPHAIECEASMKPTARLHKLGQSLWLDNITRTLLDDGTLARYIADCSITGLTSNPSIFDAAIGESEAYDAAIRQKTAAGSSGEALFVELALEDLRRAADLFRPIFEATDHGDGWVSMEVSPLLAADTAGSVAAAKKIHAQAARENLFVKIPGTPEGVAAIEQAIFLGIPINVTLLFSRAQYLAAAEAYLRGIERRIAAGLDPRVGSVASLFISRWDVASNKQLPKDLHNTLGIAVGQQTYRAYRELLDSPRWNKLAAAGAQPQRLLWASTGTKDPTASDTLYIRAFAAADTINTMPEKTLHAFADHGELQGAMAVDGGDSEATIARITKAGIDVDALATMLQKEGAEAFVKSWQQLLQKIADKAATLDSDRKASAK